MKKVILLTHSDDYYNVDLIANELSNLNYESIRINTDEFPSKLKLTSCFINNNLNYILHSSDMSLNLKDVRAVWNRHIGIPNISKDIDTKYKETSQKESYASLIGFLDGLAHAKWIDRLDLVNKAENKPYQLRVASEVGLKYPSTLITNNPEQVKQFYYSLKGNIICKMLTALTFSMNSPKQFVYTQLVVKDDLNNLESLSLCPMIFQEYIPPKYELRIAYVDGKFFYGKIETDGSSPDWRKPTQKTLKWKKVLKHPVNENILHNFMQKLQLKFGAIDIIVSQKNQPYFLEVNPCGEWGMLERFLKLPISKYLAKALVFDL